MNKTFSIDSYKKVFDEYASRYDRSDGRVELKIIHTNAVVSIMAQICENRHLPEHTEKLALLCALFHDIGRFEQLKQYDTFLDHKSIDHALLGCQVLKENGILDSLPPQDKENVLTAIANHNRLEIDPAIVTAAKAPGASDESRELLELCKLIRDADKCDIFRVFAVDDMTDVVGVPDETVAKEVVSPAVMDAMRSHRCIDKRLRRTYLDFWASFLGFFFDLNYPESLAIAKKQGYYRVPFDRVTFEKPEAKKQVAEILSIVEDYIDHFTGRPD